MQSAGGESLNQIIGRKEAERRSGNGVFWWGIGTSLGSAVEDNVVSHDSTLPVLFSRQLSPPQKKDADPDHVCVWNAWRSKSGLYDVIPDHVLVTGASNPATSYYALCCHSDASLKLTNHGQFDPQQCQTMSGKVPGASQVTCLLRNMRPGGHSGGRYSIGFKATLAYPWTVRLTDGRLLTPQQRQKLSRFKIGDDWIELVRSLRGTPSRP